MVTEKIATRIDITVIDAHQVKATFKFGSAIYHALRLSDDYGQETVLLDTGDGWAPIKNGTGGWMVRNGCISCWARAPYFKAVHQHMVAQLKNWKQTA